MGNHVSQEANRQLSNSSLGTEFLARLDRVSRGKVRSHANLLRSCALVILEHRRAVESARDTGLCVAQRTVRVSMMRDGTWQVEERDGCSGEWRALGSP